MKQLLHALPYTIGFLFPMIAFATFLGWIEFSWVLPIVAFVIIPILDQVLPYSEDNLSKEDVEDLKESPVHSFLLMAMLPIQWMLIATLCIEVSTASFADLNWHWVGMIFSMGICCGTFGINVAHELGHRNDRLSQFCAKGLLMSSLYMHFIIEHNRGHHRHVATDLDPATSKKGQLVYHFWIQSTLGAVASAWQLEEQRLEKKKLAWYHNEMIWMMLLQFSVVIGIGLTLGAVSMISFVFAATIGFLLLETINYIEHYGLQRSLRDNGKFERVKPHHSWNCNRSIGRLLLFELTRHSDHHAYAKRPYQILRHFDTAPQLPAGYPAMIVLALVPPLWFMVMDKQLEMYQSRVSC